MFPVLRKLIDFFRRKPKISSMLLVSPAIGFLVFMSVSLFSLFLISFYRYVPIGTGQGKLWEPTITLGNYVGFLTDPFYLNYILVTLKISAIVTVVSLIGAYPVAYFLVRTKSSILKQTILFLTILTFFINLVIRMYAWTLILEDTGIIDSVLVFLRIIPQPLPLIYNEFGVIVGLMHWGLPLTVFAMVGSIQNINPTVEEAAKALGASKLQTFLRITLPLSLPGIIVATLLTFATNIAAFVTPMMLGGGKVDFLGNLIYQKILLGSNYPFGSAVSMILLLVTLVISYVIGNLLMKKVKV